MWMELAWVQHLSRTLPGSRECDPHCLMGKPPPPVLFAAGRRISEQAWQSFLELAGGAGTHDEAFRIDELCRDCLATE